MAFSGRGSRRSVWLEHEGQGGGERQAQSQVGTTTWVLEPSGFILKA